MNRRIALVLMAAACCGCGKEPPPKIVPAAGVVLLGGSPLPNAQVRLIPLIDIGAEYISSAVTDDQGNFELKCNGQPGACATESMVLVAEADIPHELLGENRQRELAGYLRSLKNRPIPPKYGSAASTPLKASISDSQGELKFELAR